MKVNSEKPLVESAATEEEEIGHGQRPSHHREQTAPVASPVVTIQGEIVDQYRVPADADPDESVEVIIADINSFGR